MKITKVVITGYIGYPKTEIERASLEGLGRIMDEGYGKCVDIEFEELNIQTQDDLPTGVEEFFVIDEDE